MHFFLQLQDLDHFGVSPQERLIPKSQEGFTFPAETSSVVFDRNYCLTLLDSIKQCTQFYNPRTKTPVLNPYVLKRYDEGLNGDPTQDS